MGTPTKTYARSRGVDPKAVRRGIAEGVIAVDDNGQIADVEQADAAWLSTRRGSRLGQRQVDEAGVQSATAKAAVAAAALRLKTAKFETVSARYVDRQEAVTSAVAEAAYAIAALRAAPDGPAAETFAAALGIDVETARQILRDFTERVVAEIGDLEAMAAADVARA